MSTDVWMSKDGEYLFLATPVYEKETYSFNHYETGTSTGEHFHFLGYHISMHEDVGSMDSWDISHNRVITDEAINRVAVKLGDL